MKNKLLLVFLVGILAKTLLLGQDVMDPTIPAADIYNDPVWKARFLGSYGFSATEPEPKDDEEKLALKNAADMLGLANFNGAIDELERLTKAKGGNVSAVIKFSLANLYFQKQNEKEAKKYYIETVKDFPDYLQARKNLGLVYFRESNYDKCIENYTKALQLGDNSAMVYGLLGVCFHSREHFISAEAAYRQALIDEPDNDDWKLNLARCLLQQDKYKDAIGIINELLDKDPEDKQLWLLQGNAFLGLGQIDKAAGNLEILRRMGKADTPALLHLGDIYMNKQMTVLAYGAYDDALKAKEGKKDVDEFLRSADSLMNFAAHGLAQKLISSIRRAFRNNISEEQNLKILTLDSQIDIVQDRPEKAVPKLERIISLDPLNGRALIILGKYYRDSAKNYEQAIFMFERASELEDYRRNALVELGKLMVAQKRWDEAVDLLQRAQDVEYQESVQSYLDQVDQVRKVYHASRN